MKKMWYNKMNLTILSVPYDSALRSVGMGAGPEHLIGAGLSDRLAALGYTVERETIEHETDPPAEIRTGFELMRGIAVEVRRAVRGGRFPIVLSGNCNAAVGTLGGLGEDIGLVWFDAHGDFNTPETTTSGFLDGTALATLMGRCWESLAATVPGFHPLPEADVVLAGVRDLRGNFAFQAVRQYQSPCAWVLEDGSYRKIVNGGRLYSLLILRLLAWILPIVPLPHLRWI